MWATSCKSDGDVFNGAGKETLQPNRADDAFEIVKSFGKIYVGGLMKTTTTSELRDFFLQFGHISRCVLKYTSFGVPRGFGYVTYENPSNIEFYVPIFDIMFYVSKN